MSSRTITDDYYAVLGVDSTADANTLKAVWRQLAKVKHPDKNPGNPNATVEFQLLESAYSTLSDPRRRMAYDNLRSTPHFDSSNRSTNEHHGHRHTTAEAQSPPSSPSQHRQDPVPEGDTARRHALVALRADIAAQEAQIVRQRQRMNTIRREFDELMDAARTYKEVQLNLPHRGVRRRIGITFQSFYKPDQQEARCLKAEELMVQFEVLHALEKHLGETKDRVRQLEAFLTTTK
ncbi:DnaJ-domain-containing protein [Hypoxylon sp. FL0890]|nr:DnaJ-domain-containing protein [Hypoxylon sp. FL0890]